MDELEIGSLCRFRHRGKGWRVTYQRYENGESVSIDSNDLFMFLGTELFSLNLKKAVHKILHPDHGILTCSVLAWGATEDIFERINEDD